MLRNRNIWNRKLRVTCSCASERLAETSMISSWFALFVCVSIYRPVCLFVFCLFALISLFLPYYVCPFVYLVCLGIYLSVCLPVLHVCLSVCLSSYLSVHLSVSFSVFRITIIIEYFYLISEKPVDT